MGKAVVEGTITGASGTRRYEFVVGPRHPFVGLPEEEIAGLGLAGIANGGRTFQTDSGVVKLATYSAQGTVLGELFAATVVPAPVPVLGLQLLENHGFTVNPETQRVEAIPGFEYYLPTLIPIADDDDI